MDPLSLANRPAAPNKSKTRGGRQRGTGSPGSNDLHAGPDQVMRPLQPGHKQQSSDVISLTSDSEDAADHSSQPPSTLEDKTAAAAARDAARRQQLAARAAAEAAADVMCISDSEDQQMQEDSAAFHSCSSGSDSEQEHQQQQPSRSKQQQPQQQPAGRVTRQASRPQQQQQPQQLVAGTPSRACRDRHARAQHSGHGSSSGSESCSTEESDSSNGSESEASSSASESDTHAAPARRTGQHNNSAPLPLQLIEAAVGPSSHRTQQASQAGAAGSRQAAAGAAAATPKKASSRAQQAAAAADTPSRPVRNCTQTPQRSTRPAAAGAATAQTPGLSTPLGKLSLNSSKSGEAPGSQRALRSSSRQAAPPSASTRKASASAAAAAATPSKQGRKQGPSAAAAATPKAKGGGRRVSSKPVPLLQVEVDGEVLLPGDDVYLQLDGYEDPDSDEEEEEVCEVCSSSSSSRGNAMLECSACLRGFHMRCLQPRLKKVPEGDWLCPGCNAGEPPQPPARLVSAWQKLLYGSNELALVHVTGMQRGRSPEGEEEEQLLVQYYVLPQETHVGRQPHHAAREVFLGTQVFTEPACAVHARAYVHTPADFADAPEAEGNDVYLCEYEYDEAWKRFRKRRSAGAGGDDLAGPGSSCPMTPAGLRLTPSKAKGAAGSSGGGGRRLFAGGSDSSGSEYSESDSDGADDTYRPDPHHLSGRGKGALSKRKRHGQLPGSTNATKFVGLGAAEVAQQRGEVKDVFAKLHASLSLGSVPDSLPCREEERRRLGGFLNRALSEDGGVLYICGVPGTGKTALVMESLRALRAQAQAAGAQLVVINCLQLPSPQHVFSRLWEKLSGQHLGPARACEALMQAFGINGSGSSKRRHYNTLIVLDEIDMLMTRDQAVLYQVFDWPNQPGSRLSVIGISNTHDLDQRVLPRIASRLDQAKLAFNPYSVAQLNTIVRQRLQESGVAGAVDDQAVMLTCRKVAQETGDVRRALELLRRAVEIGRARHLANIAPRAAAAAAGAGSAAAAAASRQAAAGEHEAVLEWQEGSPVVVGRPDVSQAQQEMFGALHLQLLRSRSLWEKLLLVAVVVEARATGRSAVVMQSVAERASSSICALVDLAPPALGVLQHCLVKLSSVRLLLADGSHIKAQVALNVDKDDVAIAIKEDERLAPLHTLL